MFFYFLKAFSSSLAPVQRVVEDINDQASDFTANNVALSRQILQRLEDINTRYFAGWKVVEIVRLNWIILSSSCYLVLNFPALTNLSQAAMLAQTPSSREI